MLHIKADPPSTPGVGGGEKMGEMITPAVGRVHVHARTHLKEPRPVPKSVPKTPCGTWCGHPKGLSSATLPPHHSTTGMGARAHLGR